jgi:hypothetical protein
MVGIILFTAMAAGGLSLWLKRRKKQKEFEHTENDFSDNL